jgi:hypothetical protein
VLHFQNVRLKALGEAFFEMPPLPRVSVIAAGGGILFPACRGNDDILSDNGNSGRYRADPSASA